MDSLLPWVPFLLQDDRDRALPQHSDLRRALPLRTQKPEPQWVYLRQEYRQASLRPSALRVVLPAHADRPITLPSDLCNSQVANPCAPDCSPVYFGDRQSLFRVDRQRLPRWSFLRLSESCTDPSG